MAEAEKVSIRIDVTDNAQPAIQGVTQSLNKMGEAGATSGAQVETAMKGMTGATTAAGVEMNAMQTRLRALGTQIQALSPAGIKTFNEQVVGYTRQGISAIEAQEMALTRLKAVYAQIQALSPAGMKIFRQQMREPMPAATSFFRESIPGAAVQNMATLAAQEGALARTTQLLEQNAAGATKAAGGYGEMRIAIGAATGNLRQMEFGLASVAGRMKGVGALFSTMMPALVAVAAVGIIVQMGEAVYQLYEKWLDTDGAIDRYNAKAAEAAEKRFFQNSGLDELNRDLKLANQQVDELQKKRATGLNPIIAAMASSSMLYQPGQTPPPAFTMSDANQLNQAQGKSDQDRLRMLADLHKENVQQITDAGAIAEASMKPAARAAQARATAKEIGYENQIAAIALQDIDHEITSRPTGLKPGDKDYTPPVAAPTGSAQDLAAARSRIAEMDKLPLSTTGSAERRMADEHAAAQYKRAQIQNATETQNEILRLQHQADEAGLTGIRLLEQKRTDADSEYVALHGQNAAVLAEIDKKYYADETKLQDEQNKQRRQAAQEAARELTRLHDETLAAGLTGAARIRQEGENKIREFQPTPGMNYIQYFSALHDVAQQTAGALARESQSFADEVSGVLGRTVDRSVAGFARIHAEANAEIEKLKSDYAAKGGRPEDLARGVAGVRKNEAGDVTALQQRNKEQTEALEAEARSKYLSAEKQKTVAIENEYEERLRKFQEELDQQEISQQDYDRRVVASAQIRDAEMAENAKRERDKMAGEFTSFFHSLDHPMRALANMGDKVAGQAAAALVQRLQNRGGPHGHPEELSGGSIFGDIFGRIAGKPRAATAEDLGIAAQGAAKKSIALAHAEIFVQNASIGFANAGSRGAGAPGGVVGSSGTLLATSFHAGASGGFGGGFSRGSGAGSSADSTELASTPTPASATGAFGPGGWTGGNFSAPGTATAAIGDAQQIVGMGQQAATIFGGAGKIGKGLDKLGGLFGGGSSTTSAAKNAGMLGGGGFGANLAGAAGGALGLFSAYEGKGGIGGAASGAMSGMQLGMAFGGPIGAGIGAAAGAIIGAIGFGGREQARVYDLKTVRPRIAQDVQAYETGGMTYLSAYSDVQSLMAEARNATNKMGSGAQGYYQDTMKPEFSQAEAHFSAMEKAGRSNYTMATAQFDVGSDYVPRDGMAVIHEGERIMPSDQNERITQALEGGADSRRMPASTGFGGDVHLHVHAMDAKGVKQFLFDNKHGIRAAVNASFAENSGGADA